ncbi:hypothetical protein AVEN_167472-1 [Araneus ventricosus]|uniref:Uncharacterized protein n=1 Tax=Araneus ventricosus TaxID=182803 RepID=A0A4Y2IEC2_ARAVE|nr:hypothetical protein AVEN_167472-1 [Araneus ventricosus]
MLRDDTTDKFDIHGTLLKWRSDYSNFIATSEMLVPHLSCADYKALFKVTLNLDNLLQQGTDPTALSDNSLPYRRCRQHRVRWWGCISLFGFETPVPVFLALQCILYYNII